MRALIISIALVLGLLALPATASEAVTDRHGRILAANPIQGPALNSEALKGKTVVVTFFASWCPPCVHEFKVLKQVRAQYDPKDVTLVAINVFEELGAGNDALRLKRFLKRADQGISVIEGDKAIRDAFGGVDRIPTLVVHDPAGAESFRFVHERDAEIMSVDHKTLVGAIDKARTAAIN